MKMTKNKSHTIRRHGRNGKHKHRHSHRHDRKKRFARYFQCLARWYLFYGLDRPDANKRWLRKLARHERRSDPLSPFVIEFRHKFRNYRIPKLAEPSKPIDWKPVEVSQFLQKKLIPLGFKMLTLFLPSQVERSHSGCSPCYPSSGGEAGEEAYRFPIPTAPKPNLTSYFWSARATRPSVEEDDTVVDLDVLVLQPEVLDALDIKLM